MVEKWCRIEAVGFAVIDNQKVTANISSNLFFQAILSAIALAYDLRLFDRLTFLCSKVKFLHNQMLNGYVIYSLIQQTNITLYRKP